MTLVDLEPGRGDLRGDGPGARDLRRVRREHDRGDRVARRASPGSPGKVADDEFGEVFRHDLTALDVELDLAVVARSDGGDRSLPRARHPRRAADDGDAPRRRRTRSCRATSRARSSRGRAHVPRGLPLRPAAGEAGDPRRNRARPTQRTALVALSLSDSFCVERHRKDFLELRHQRRGRRLRQRGGGLRAVLRRRRCPAALEAFDEVGVLAAVTLGPRGAVVVTASGIVDVPACEVGPGRRRERRRRPVRRRASSSRSPGAPTPSRRRELGSVCAAEVIVHLGARPMADLVAAGDRRGPALADRCRRHPGLEQRLGVELGVELLGA